jgi:hypothetical protein
MTLVFSVRIEQQLPSEVSLSLAQCLLVQKTIAQDGTIAQQLLDGAGKATITVTIADGAPEIDEVFKAAVMSLPKNTRVRDLMQMGIFTSYRQAVGRNRGALITGALVGCSRQGFSTLADLYEVEKDLLRTTRNIGKKRADLLAWLFDLK